MAEEKDEPTKATDVDPTVNTDIPPTSPSPPPEVKEPHRLKKRAKFHEVVQEVIDGKWGRGNELRQKLNEEGWNPNHVLSAVTQERVRGQR